MKLRIVILVLLTPVLIVVAGCPKYNSDLSEESQRACIAVQKMGGGGFSSTTVHEGRGKAHNRIEINFRASKKINNNALMNLEGLGGIVGIDLSETAISDDGLAILASLPDLEYLQLADTTITDRGLVFLAECTKLKRLDIRRTRISANALEVLKEFPNLEMVYAKGTVLSPDQLVNTEDELGSYFRVRSK